MKTHRISLTQKHGCNSLTLSRLKYQKLRLYKGDGVGAGHEPVFEQVI